MVAQTETLQEGVRQAHDLVHTDVIILKLEMMVKTISNFHNHYFYCNSILWIIHGKSGSNETQSVDNIIHYRM